MTNKTAADRKFHAVDTVVYKFLVLLWAYIYLTLFIAAGHFVNGNDTLTIDVLLKRPLSITATAAAAAAAGD